MKDLEKLVFNKLKDNPSRINHVKGVIKVAEELAKIHDEDVLKAKLAALFHDYTKYDDISEQTKYLDQEIIKKYQDNEFMYHPYSAAIKLKQLIPNVQDDILDAIRYHVFGRPNMTKLEKIILISDKSEPSRTFEDAKIIYNLALNNLDDAVLYLLESSLKHLKSKGIKPLDEQIQTYNYYKRKEEIMVKYESVVKVLEDIKAKDIKVYDFNKTSPFYDYFIIATVNERQANAAANNLKQSFKDELLNIEGKSSGWVLVDLNDVIVHLFQAQEREFYGLDKMLYGFQIDNNK